MCGKAKQHKRKGNNGYFVQASEGVAI